MIQIQTQPPVSGNRWRVRAGCSGCVVLLLICVLTGSTLASIGYSAYRHDPQPEPALEAGGVVLRAILDIAPPSTDLPENVSLPDDMNDDTPENVAYAKLMLWNLNWMSQSERRLRSLNILSSIWTSRWKSQIAAEAARWRQLAATVQQVDPPGGYEAFNTRVVQAFNAYDAAADDIDQFVQTGDQDALNDSKAELQRGDALSAEAQLALNGNGMAAEAPGPSGSSDEMIAGLAREDDLPDGWVETSIPEDYDDYGPLYPCDSTALFYPDEIDASAGVSFETNTDDGYLQEILVHVGEHTAETGMLAAKADFPCEPWTDDDGYSYHIAPLDVPLIGDDTVGYQYTEFDDEGKTDTVTNVILVRVRGLVIEVWHSQFGAAPALDETEQMARIMLTKAQSIPIDPEPDPGNGIQVNRGTRLPSG